MLRALRIRNFAILDSLDLFFDRGLTVFTGETGAGKTILVEAIRFLLGGKSGLEMIRTGADSASVEGDFDGMILRRELNAQGRSRAFRDDQQITISELAALGDSLADHCGQHQHQVLLDPHRHMEWLDRFGGAEASVAQLKSRWSHWSSTSYSLRDLTAKLERRQSEEELRRFQIQEIRAANLEPEEEERLRAEATVMKHARRLAEAADLALNSLSESDSSVESALSRACREAENAAQIDPRWQEILAPLTSANESVIDAVRALSIYRDHLAFDPHRADEIESRLSEIFRLKKKYGDSCAATLDYLKDLEAEESSDLQLEDELKRLRSEFSHLTDTIIALAADLSIRRHRAAESLVKEVNPVVARLGMPKASVRIELIPHTEGGLTVGDVHIDENGAESTRFLFEANPAEGFKPLHKIASGGELSRLLLAFKSTVKKGGSGPAATDRGMVAAALEPPLYIFDEIDAGLGGQTAHAVAREIKSLSKNAQVFLITHLQQLATAADAHYRITKQTRSGRARVIVERLEGDDRIRELARMIAGDEVTDQTLAFAAELARPRSGKKP